ncbi:MAG: type II toxin-antitoxin system PemK/MazF family toxin [Firmicutes bacterium]|nr:type II toxin-antitoxin system PemK/MazF family toxin [Bacillota bacterium]
MSKDSKGSIVLIDQIRAVDVRRTKAYLGSLDTKAFYPIRARLFKLLGFASGWTVF